ncbi:MAG: hypothetical protein GY697_13240 [Desulfobacterales bacterium]|nr:hypothetical protein [Desulfobacterales bacterium]
MNSTIRRSILKTIGIGSAWSTPIVSSVMLPAHAATTDDVIVDKEYLSAGSYQLIVPEGITQLSITVNGAGGGTANTKQSKKTRTGGNGGQQTQTVTTAPGHTLEITVGGGGQDGYADSPNKNGKRRAIPGAGGTPAGIDGGEDAFSWGGGGGGMSKVTGPSINVRAPGGGGGSGGVNNKLINYSDKKSSGGDGGGTFGGNGGNHVGSGGNGGNGLGGLGSSTAHTVNNPSQGEDGSVIITSV